MVKVIGTNSYCYILHWHFSSRASSHTLNGKTKRDIRCVSWPIRVELVELCWCSGLKPETAQALKTPPRTHTFSRGPSIDIISNTASLFCTLTQTSQTKIKPFGSFSLLNKQLHFFCEKVVFLTSQMSPHAPSLPKRSNSTVKKKILINPVIYKP